MDTRKGIGEQFTEFREFSEGTIKIEPCESPRTKTNIREGIDHVLLANFGARYEVVTTKLIEYLASQGVAKKVERELPKPPHEHQGGYDNTAHSMGYRTAQQDMLDEGYTMTEEL